MMEGHQGPGFALAQEHLRNLEAQVAAEEKKLADCRADRRPLHPREKDDWDEEDTTRI